MTRACSRCGRIHPSGYKCNAWRTYPTTDERKLRAKNKWHEKARAIKEEAQSLCELCRTEGRYISRGLEVHHIEKLADHPELLLEDTNLICLCQDCHKQADAGKIDKELLKRLATQRGANNPPGV